MSLTDPDGDRMNLALVQYVFTGPNTQYFKSLMATASHPSLTSERRQAHFKTWKTVQKLKRQKK